MAPFRFTPLATVPTGIWRMPEFGKVPNSSASPLAYTVTPLNSENKDPVRPFVEALRSLRPDVTVAYTGRLLVTISDVPIQWECGIWSDGNLAVFTLSSAGDKLIVPGKKNEDVLHVGRLGKLEVAFSGPSVAITVEDHEQFPPKHFRFQQSGAYVDVYSYLTPAACRTWLNERRQDNNVKHRVKIGRLHFELPFCSPECKTCLGVHDDIDCPLRDASDFDPDTDMTAVDDESTANMSFEAVKSLLSSSAILSRSDLVDQIIDHVSAKHFLLIEAPPCSGKTTLLNDVLLTVMKRYPAYGINHLSDKIFKPRIIANHQGPGITNATELAEYVTRLSSPFWLFIDEAQLLYVYEDPFLWKILCSKEPNPYFFVLAAGSYGSHTASLSHSPPSHIEITDRMNLFKTTDSLALAFTLEHFDAFVALPKFRNHLTNKWKKCIKKYASPHQIPSQMVPGMHPGVVAQMAPFIVNRLCKPNPGEPRDGETSMMKAFFEACLADTLRPCGPTDLGRCVPRRPDHKGSPIRNYGFTPAALLVFSAVLMHGSVLVRTIDKNLAGYVVSNAVAHLTDKRAETITLSSVNRKHIRDSRVADHSFPDVVELEQVTKYIDPSKIAITPAQRFLDVVPGLNIDHLTGNLKPFAVRQLCKTGDWLSDMDQAAHDARQMGWLLQVPSEEVQKVKLVLPSRWHLDYLKFLLIPHGVPPDVLEMGIDEFIHALISHFRPSVLYHFMQQEEVIREKIYDSEFLHAARIVAMDPRFLTPQARTESGDGYADFVVNKNKWVIELMRDGINAQGHINRLEKGGKYHKQWPTYDWRIVDFRLNKSTIVKHKDSDKFRTVILTPAFGATNVIHAKIFGKNLSPQFMTATLNG